MTVITLSMIVEHFFIILGSSLFVSILSGIPHYRTYANKLDWILAAREISVFVLGTSLLVYFMVLVILDGLKVVSL